MKINVLILPERRTGSGEAHPEIPLSGIRDDIAGAFALGDPENWTMALVPADLNVAPQNYTLSQGDTVLMMPSAAARRKGFVGGPDQS